MLKQDDKMTHVEATFAGVSTLSATIEQSKIALKVTGPTRKDAEYFVTFSSGTLQFLVGENRSVTIVPSLGGRPLNTPVPS